MVRIAGKQTDEALLARQRPDLPALSGQFRHQSLEWIAADGTVLRSMAQ